MTDTMTTAEVAAHLRTTPRTVTRWARSGRLPYLHKSPGPRGAYVFSRAAIDAAAEGT